MSKRRMISPLVTSTDLFLDMPSTAQNYYFHLNLNADDDGFVSNPQTIRRNVRASADDFHILVAKGFIIGFESGVIVIKHWRIHNLIRKDRYTETQHLNEKELLDQDENKAYVKRDSQLTLFNEKTEIIVEESTNNIKKETEVKTVKAKVITKKYGELKNVDLTDEQLEKLKNRTPKYKEYIEKVSLYQATSGKKYKDHYAAILTFMRRDGVSSDSQTKVEYVSRRRR